MAPLLPFSSQLVMVDTNIAASAPSDQDIMQQMEFIQEEQRKALLVGEKRDISDLVAEYSGGTSTMQAKVKVCLCTT